MRGGDSDVVRRVRKQLAALEVGGAASLSRRHQLRADLAELRRRLRRLNARHGGRFRVEFSPHVIDCWQTTSLMARPATAFAS